MAKDRRHGHDPDASFSIAFESSLWLYLKSRIATLVQLSCVRYDMALAVKSLQLRSRSLKRGQLDFMPAMALISGPLKLFSLTVKSFNRGHLHVASLLIADASSYS